MVNFAQDKVQTALDYFIQALQSFPSCGASVRMAIATCCFKLKQYDRGKAALDRAFEMDVRSFCESFLFNAIRCFFPF